MGKKLLVVDDDMVGITLMFSRLTKEGYEVVKAMNGEDGLAAMRENEIDLVILDVEMPGMSGYNVVYEMGKIDVLKDTPVIVLTAHEENRKIFARKGIVNYMVKPVDFDVLFPLITKLLTTVSDSSAPGS